MGSVEMCDLCKKPIMESFSDVAYKVKLMKHYYDGAVGVPGRTKIKLDVCPVCMDKIVKRATP